MEKEFEEMMKKQAKRQESEAENVGKFVKDWASDTYNSIGGDIQNRVEKRKRVNEIKEALKEI
jgi:hypothetical protein